MYKKSPSQVYFETSTLPAVPLKLHLCATQTPSSLMPSRSNHVEPYLQMFRILSSGAIDPWLIRISLYTIQQLSVILFSRSSPSKPLKKIYIIFVIMSIIIFIIFRFINTTYHFYFSSEILLHKFYKKATTLICSSFFILIRKIIFFFYFSSYFFFYDCFVSLEYDFSFL